MALPIIGIATTVLGWVAPGARKYLVIGVAVAMAAGAFFAWLKIHDYQVRADCKQRIQIQLEAQRRNLEILHEREVGRVESGHEKREADRLRRVETERQVINDVTDQISGPTVSCELPADQHRRVLDFLKPSGNADAPTAGKARRRAR